MPESEALASDKAWGRPLIQEDSASAASTQEGGTGSQSGRHNKTSSHRWGKPVCGDPLNPHQIALGATRVFSQCVSHVFHFFCTKKLQKIKVLQLFLKYIQKSNMFASFFVLFNINVTKTHTPILGLWLGLHVSKVEAAIRGKLHLGGSTWIFLNSGGVLSCVHLYTCVTPHLEVCRGTFCLLSDGVGLHHRCLCLRPALLPVAGGDFNGTCIVVCHQDCYNSTGRKPSKDTFKPC